MGKNSRGEVDRSNVLLFGARTLSLMPGIEVSPPLFYTKLHKTNILIAYSRCMLSGSFLIGV